MKYISTFIFSFLLSISIVNAQCPTDGNTEATIVSTDALCFGAEDGTISFELKDAGDVSLDPANFSFALYDGGENDFVYDDIGLSTGIDVNPAITLTFAGTVITFSNVPTTKDGIGYTIGARDNGICGGVTRQYSSGFLGIVINEPAELLASINTVTDDCNNTGTGGAIDIDVSGGTPDGGGNYAYSWNNGATTQDISGLPAGTYDVTVTDDNGCTTSISGIEVDPGPEAGTPTAADVCSSITNFALFDQLAGEDTNGDWALTGGTGTGSPAFVGASTDGIVDFTNATTGTYEYTYTVPATASCVQDQATVVMTVEEAPEAGTPTAAITCNTVNNFPLFDQLADEDTNGDWALTGGTGTGSPAFVGVSTDGIVDFTGVSAGTYEYTYTVPATTNCPQDQATVEVTVEESPEAGTPTAADVCSSITNFALFDQLAGEDTNGDWALTGGTGTGSPAFVGASTDGIVDFTNATTGTYEYTYTVPATAGCVQDQATVVMTVEEAPEAGTPTAAITCNTVNNFPLFDQLADEDANGDWALTGGTGTGSPAFVGVSTDGIVDFTGVSAGTYEYTYTVPATTNCPQDQATVEVTVEESPEAGTPTAADVCSSITNFALFDQLAGEDTNGDWALTGGTGTGSPAFVGASTDGIVDFTNATTGTYEYTYTVPATAGCVQDQATVVMTVEEAPEAGTPTAAITCNTVNNFPLFDQLADEDTNGDWALTGGTGTGSPAFVGVSTDGIVDFTGVSAGTYEYTYTVPATTNCPQDQATVEVTVEESPEAGTPTAADVCSSITNFALFDQLAGEDTNGDWALTGGTGTGSPAFVGASTDGIVDFTNATTGTYEYTYTVPATAGCVQDQATVVMTVEEAPEAGTPTAAITCNTVNNFPLFDQLADEDANGDWALTGGTGTGSPAFVGVSTDGIVDFTGVSAGTYEYTYTVPATTNCPQDQATVEVTVEESPEAGTPTAADVCSSITNFALFDQLAGEDTNGDWALTGGTGTGSPAFVGASTDGIVDFTNATTGTYEYTYTVPATASCVQDQATVVMTVEEAPEAGTPTAAITCNTVNNFPLFDQLADEDTNGDWALTGGTGTGSPAFVGVSTDGIVDFTGVSAGTYEYTYTVPATTNCPQDQATVEVTVEESPEAGTPTAADVCSSITNFALFDQLAGEDTNGDWALTGGTGTGSPAFVGASTDGIVDFTNATTGTYEYTYTVPATAGCVQDQATVVMTVEEAPEAGTPTAAITCNTVNNFPLFDQLADEDANGDWALTGGTGTGSPAFVGVSTDGIVDFTGVSAGTYEYTYTVPATTNCPQDQATVEVTVEESPEAGTPTAADVCSSITNFALFDQLAGEDTNGDWALTGGTGTGSPAFVGASTDGIVDFTNATTGTYEYTYTVPATASCVQDQATVVMTVEEAPEAGTPTAAITCNTVNNFPLFDQLADEDTNGDWALTGGTGTGSPAFVGVSTDGIVDFTGVSAGTYEYTYTVPATTNCPQDQATVEVTVEESPEAGTPTAADVCSSITNFALFDQLAGEDTNGDWALTGGTGTGSPAFVGASTDGIVDFTNATTGTYEYTYTVPATAGCVQDQATVVMTVEEAPEAGTSTAAITCNTVNNFPLFDQLADEDTNGDWALTGGTGTGSPSFVGVSTDGIVDFTGVSAGTYEYTYTVPATTNCPQDQATVEVTVEESPEAGTPTAADVCSSITNFALFDQLAGEDTNGDWALTGGTGTGSPAFVGASTDGIVDFTNATTGTYEYTYTVPATASCVQDQATVVMTVEEAPEAGTPTAAVTCNTVNNFPLFDQLAGEDTNGDWALTGGTGTGSPAFVGVSTDGIVDFTGVSAGTYEYTYTVPATTNCPQDQATVEVTVEESPEAGTPTAADVCSSITNFALFDQLAGEDTNGDWALTGGTGTGSPAFVGASTDGIVDFTNATTGTYEYTYTVPATASCVQDQATVVMTVEEAPEAGTPTAAITCNTVNNFPLFDQLADEDTNGDWALTGGTGTGSPAFVGVSTDGIVDFTGVSAGTYEYTYTVPATTNCPQDQATVEVTVEESPEAGTPTAADVCSSVTNFALFDQLAGEDTNGDWALTGGTGTGSPVFVGASTDGIVDFTNATTGTYEYTYTVPATASCVQDQATVVMTVNTLTASETITNTSGCGVEDGAINLNVASSFTGDTYTFSWTGPNGFTSNAEDISLLEAGDYTVIIDSDNTSCSFTETYTVVDPVPFTISTSSTDQTSCAVNDGSISVTLASGTGPFNYYIVDTNTALEVAGSRSDSDASTSYSFASLAPGDYEVFVEEGPCVDSETFTVNAVAEIVASVDSETPAACGGGTDGTITLAVTDVGNDYEVIVDAGTPTLVSAGTTSFTITGLSLGTYDIEVRDVNTNCSVDLTEDIDENATFSIDSENVIPIATCGGAEGEIELIVSGGTPSFSWTGPAGFTAGDVNIISGLTEAGTYEATLQEAGCTVIRTYNIGAPTPPTSVAGADSTICLPTIQLYADALAPDQTGEWQIVSQPAGAVVNIIDPTSPTTNFEDLFELGDYTLAWILENTITSCSDSDTIVITRKDITVADAGTNIETCEAVNALTANAAGANETGTWTVFNSPPGIATPATFDDENVENTNFNITDLTVSGDYVIRWTITDDNSICTETFEDITVTYELPLSAGTFNAAPSVEVTSENSPLDLFSLLDNEDTGGTWSLSSSANGGGVNPTFDATTGEVDLTVAETGIYEFTYTVNGTLACATDSETVTVDFLNFQCEDTKFTSLTEDATCQGVQDGSIFLFLQNVSNTNNFDVTINSVVMDTFSIQVANPGSGSLVQIDTLFFSGNYEVILNDNDNNCSDTLSVLVGQKQSILPLVNTSDATCDNPVGQIQVTIDGTFNFVLLNSTDTPITTNTTGLFTDLSPATYGIAFTNSGGCQVDTVKNIIINEPTQVSNSALDLTVVEPSCATTTAQILVNFDLDGEYLYEILDTDGVSVFSITTDAGEWTTELDTLGVFELVVTNTASPGICEPANRNFEIDGSGSFTATVTNKTDIACFGAFTGSVTIELDGISSGFYSLSGSDWTAFISGEPITDLPARQNILVSDQVGAAGCNISVAVNITEPATAFEFDGEVTTETPASCTASEETGQIVIPEVVGGVAPYLYFIDGIEVELPADRILGGLSRTAQTLTVEDASGCTFTENISTKVSPNEIRVNQVIQLSPDDICVEEPEGVTFVLSQQTINSIPGPYLLTLNKVNDTITSEIVLNIVGGDTEFTITQFNPEENISFEKGVSYSWSIRSVNDEQVCPAVSNNPINILGGAVVPSFDVNFVDVACFQGNGFIEITNIVANEDFQLFIQVKKNGNIRLIDSLDYSVLNDSRIISTNELLEEGSTGEMAGGDYEVVLYQDPVGCNSVISSDIAIGVVEEPGNELRAELIPEPDLPPGVDLSRNDMNPAPTSRPNRADGSISIRLTTTTNSPNGLYYADIVLIRPIGGNSRSDYDQMQQDSVLFGSDESITFDGLLPGVYEITFYDEFGCARDNKILGKDGTFEVLVDFDRSPFIPNVFTPNNDGKNDVFRILNLPDDGAELVVTNRTGTIVFRDSNYRSSNLWDGGDNPDGIYFYQLTVDGTTQNGWVEIIRGKR